MATPRKNGRATTLFAPPQRSGASEIAETRRRLEEQRFAPSVFDCLPQFLMVLDENRQVVLANRALLDHLASQGLPFEPGARYGELLGCIHAHEMEAGCGTSEACRTCGSVQAVLEAQRGRCATRECRLSVRRPEGNLAEDLQFTACPIPVDGRACSLVTVTDLRHEKRRRALERIFFHDLLNTAGVVSGYASLLRSGEVDELQKGLDRIAGAAQKMLAEIRSQRDLMAAEEGHLEVGRDRVDPGQALQQVVDLYRASPLAQGVVLDLPPRTPMGPLVTDQALLGRVLGNMLKNALEATPAGGTVTLGCTGSEQGVEFWVHNAAVMSRTVQLQVFQRSFSTKGGSRGLGTYSMRLLGENYLGGRVSFTSAVGEGTTFRFALPWTPRTPSARPAPWE